jgi:hypothetical protein
MADENPTGEVTHIPSDSAAIQTLLKELDWTYETLMLMADLVGAVQDGERVNFPSLKRATTTRLRESIERRDRAVDVLSAAVGT